MHVEAITSSRVSTATEVDASDRAWAISNSDIRTTVPAAVAAIRIPNATISDVAPVSGVFSGTRARAQHSKDHGSETCATKQAAYGRSP